MSNSNEKEAYYDKNRKLISKLVGLKGQKELEKGTIPKPTRSGVLKLKVWLKLKGCLKNGEVNKDKLKKVVGESKINNIKSVLNNALTSHDYKGEGERSRYYQFKVKELKQFTRQSAYKESKDKKFKNIGSYFSWKPSEVAKIKFNDFMDAVKNDFEFNARGTTGAFKELSRDFENLLEKLSKSNGSNEDNKSEDDYCINAIAACEKYLKSEGIPKDKMRSFYSMNPVRAVILMKKSKMVSFHRARAVSFILYVLYDLLEKIKEKGKDINDEGNIKSTDENSDNEDDIEDTDEDIDDEDDIEDTNEDINDEEDDRSFKKRLSKMARFWFRPKELKKFTFSAKDQKIKSRKYRIITKYIFWVPNNKIFKYKYLKNEFGDSKSSESENVDYNNYKKYLNGKYNQFTEAAKSDLIANSKYASEDGGFITFVNNFKKKGDKNANKIACKTYLKSLGIADNKMINFYDLPVLTALSSMKFSKIKSFHRARAVSFILYYLDRFIYLQMEIESKEKTTKSKKTEDGSYKIKSNGSDVGETDSSEEDDKEDDDSYDDGGIDSSEEADEVENYGSSESE